MAKGSDLQVPGWPLVVILLGPDGTAEVDGEDVLVPAGEEARAVAFSRAVATAVQIRRPVRVKLTTVDGADWVLAAHPDGAETTLQEPSAGRRRTTKAKAPKAPREKPAARKSPPKQNKEERAARLDDLLSAEPAAVEPGPAANPMTADALGTALAAEDWRTAAVELKALKGQPGVEANRVAELEAQLADLRGDAASATAQYTALALARVGAAGADDPDTQRIADKAQEVWGRIADAEQALKAGNTLLALRALIPGPSGQAMAQLRAGIARLHLS